jgi:SAM-dependent methyltransferase
MSELDKWEKTYATADYVFGTAPNRFLAACQPLLPKTGKALAVADGEGRNGVWLAEQGLDVLSVDLSPAAQAKAKRLAEAKGVRVTFALGDAHAWAHPSAAYDVVVDIFTQFSPPDARTQKWAGMLDSLKAGGLVIVQGYTPRQLEFGTGGPKLVENLYTRELLIEAFGQLHEVRITESEEELDEGPRHRGMSAIIGLTARKP